MARNRVLRAACQLDFRPGSGAAAIAIQCATPGQLCKVQKKAPESCDPGAKSTIGEVEETIGSTTLRYASKSV